MPDKPDLTPDELVTRLMSQTDGDPNLVALVGYLGEGARGHHRVYADPDLRSFIEVPDKYIVDREHIAEEEGVVGQRSMIWVSREAMSAPVPDTPQAQLESEFLSGRFVLGTFLPDTLLDIAERLTILAPRGHGTGTNTLRPTYKHCCG